MSLHSLTAAALATLSLSAFAAPTPQYQVTDRIKIGGEGRWDFVQVDAQARRLFVSHGSQVEVFDLDSNAKVGTIADTPGVHGIVTADDLGLGFVSNGKDDSVTVFDLVTMQAKTRIAVGKSPDAMTYVPALKRVVVFNGHSKNLSVIDASSLKVIGTVALPGKPEVSALSQDGLVYVNVEDTGELATFDPKAMKVVRRVKLAGCEEPSGLALDDKSNVYSVCANHVMKVTSPALKPLATVAIGGGPDGVVWTNGYAFSANGSDGNLTVVGTDSAGKWSAVATVPTEFGARTIAHDPVTGRLYLPTADFLPGSSDSEKRKTMPDTFRVLVLAPGR